MPITKKNKKIFWVVQVYLYTQYHTLIFSVVDLYADLRQTEEEDSEPLMTSSQVHDGGSLSSINNFPSWRDGSDTAIFQSAVFIEDGIDYRSIHHKIDPKSLRLYRIYYSRYVQWTLGIVIFVNLALAFFEFPTSISLSADFRFRDCTWHLSEPRCGITESIEAVCLLFFLADGITRFYLLGWRRFIKKPWLVVYALMIVASFVDLTISAAFCHERGLGYTLRIRRFFRPLFFLLSSTIMKKYIKAINLTLPQIFTVLSLLLLHVYVFAMFGLLVFPHPPTPPTIINMTNSSNDSYPETGTFSLFKNLTNSSPRSNCSIWDEYNSSYYEQLEGYKYFRTVTDALVSLIVLLTTANHPDVMMPIYQYNRFASLYFILFLLIGMYLILNLLIAVIYSQFRGIFRKSLQSSFFRRRVAFRAAFTVLARKTQRGLNYSHSKEVVSKDLVRRLLQKAKINPKQIPLMYHKLETVSSDCLSWLQFREVFDLVLKDPKRRRTDTDIGISSSIVYQWLQYIIRHPYFAYFTYVVSLVHVLMVTIEMEVAPYKALHDPMSRLAFYNFFFVLYYVLELILKLIGWGKQAYFRNIGNIYEGIITAVLFVLEIVLIALFHSPFQESDLMDNDDVGRFDTLIRVMNICVVLRLLRVIPHVKSLSLLTGTILDLIKNLRGFAGIIVVVYYIFALLGMELFANVDGYSKSKIDGVAPNLVCGKYENLTYYANNFHDFSSSLVVLWDIMVVNNWYVFLEKFSRDSDLKQWSQLYFIAWWLVSVVICVNLFVSLVLETFLTKWEAVHGPGGQNTLQASTRTSFAESDIWNVDTEVRRFGISLIVCVWVWVCVCVCVCV